GGVGVVCLQPRVGAGGPEQLVAAACDGAGRGVEHGAARVVVQVDHVLSVPGSVGPTVDLAHGVQVGAGGGFDMEGGRQAQAPEQLVRRTDVEEGQIVVGRHLTQ